MNSGWVKLYRKINENPLISDTSASHVFLWILINVDRKNGSVKIGRYWLSRILNMNPNTLKDAIKRLTKKYQVISQTSTNKFTIIRLLNWAKYQVSSYDDTTSDTNKTPTKHQQNTTNQEIRNKNREIYKPPIIPLNEKDFLEIAEKYQVPVAFVVSKWDDIENYCASTGKKYKDYKATLRNWVKKDSLKIRREFNDKSKLTIIS